MYLMFNKLHEVDSKPTEVSGTKTGNRRTESYVEGATIEVPQKADDILDFVRVLTTAGGGRALPVEVLDNAAGRIDPEGEQ
jgi:hypothetical protein